MITKKAATGAVLAAALLWLAAPAAADGLPRLVLCDDFAEVDPAQVSFCIEDAGGAVLGGGVSPTAEALPTVVADPAAPGGWGLTFPDGWAGTAVMDAPPIVAAPPPAQATPAAPAPAPAAKAPRAASPSAPAPTPTPTVQPVPTASSAAVAAPPAAPPAASPVDAGPETSLAAEDTASPESSALRWLGSAALLAGAAAAALGLRRRGTRTGAGEMGGAEGI